MGNLMDQSAKRKLDEIFAFLKANMHLNKAVQYQTYRNILCPNGTPKSRVQALTYAVFRQQSSPKLDSVQPLFRRLSEDLDDNCCFDDYVRLVGRVSMQPVPLESPCSLELLFHSLKAAGGFGDKTAALLCKSIYDIQCQTESICSIAIWPEYRIDSDDVLYLPVDAVIKYIFQNHLVVHRNTFENINEIVAERGKERTAADRMKDMAVWDDLWYWGFITQRSRPRIGRTTEWNEGKYWSLECTPDTDRVGHYKESKEQADKFMAILRQ
jgi:hypothetical protein